MVQSFLVRTEIQKRWIQNLKKWKIYLKNATENDKKRNFHKNIEWLIQEGYTKLTLPKAYGGEGATIEDGYSSKLFRCNRWCYCFIDRLALVVGQLYEQHMWDQRMLDAFAKEVVNGALVNRAVSEAETGSPTRGGRPGTHAVKVDDGYV